MNNQRSQIPVHTSYQGYQFSPFRPSTSQNNFFASTGTPKTIIVNPFNQLVNSRNFSSNILQSTPQKSHQNQMMQTRSEQKFIKSYNVGLKEKAESKRWNNLLDDDKYLKNLESKMRVLLQENDKLLALVEEKSKEIREYQEIEGKIQVILNENSRLTELLASKEQGDKSSLLSHQNEVIDKQNKEIEQLLKEIDYMRGMEEQNSVLKSRENNLQNSLHQKNNENEELFRRFEESEAIRLDYERKLQDKDRNLKMLQKDIKSLLQENEKFRNFFDEKQSEYKEKLLYLIETNNTLNEIIDKFGQNLTQSEYEKDHEKKKSDEFKVKFENLLMINEKFNEVIKSTLIEKQQNDLIKEKVEQLIENNNSLEEAYHRKHEEAIKFQELYQELSLKYEGKDENEIRNQTTREEIEVLMTQFEDLKKENYELYERNQILSHYEQEYVTLETTANKLLDENQRINDHISRMQEEFEEKEKEMIEKNENIYQEWENISQSNQELKNELERVVLEKEEISSNLHEKCMLLLEENKKLQMIVENKEQDSLNYAIKIQELEADLEEKISTLNEYQIKNDNICQDFEILKEEFEQHRLSSSKDDQDIIKLQREVEILKGQNNQWKIMNETREKEIAKIYDVLKIRKQENSQLLNENQKLKESVKLEKSIAINGDSPPNQNKILKERDMYMDINENLKKEVDNLKEQLESNMISLNYFKGEYENSVKLMEEMKIVGNLEEA